MDNIKINNDCEQLSQHGYYPQWMKKIVIDKEEMFKRRGKEVAALIIAGCQGQEIADKLYMSVPTVNRHIQRMKRISRCSSLHGLSTYLGLIFLIDGIMKVEARGNKYIISQNNLEELNRKN